MQPAPTTLDLLTSKINLGTAVLGFLTALITVSYAARALLKKIEDKQKIISRGLQIGIVVCPVSAVIASLVFNAPKVELGLFAIASVLISIDYLRESGPARRIENLTIVLTWLFTGGLFLMHILDRMVEVQTGIVRILEKVVR
jgi:hypothetical protein